MRMHSTLRARLSLFIELWKFMVVRKKWWLAPLLIAVSVMALVLAVAEVPLIAPFIYALF